MSLITQQYRFSCDYPGCGSEISFPVPHQRFNPDRAWELLRRYEIWQEREGSKTYCELHDLHLGEELARA